MMLWNPLSYRFFNSDLPPPKSARKGQQKFFWGSTCGSEVLIELETLLQIYEAQLGDWRFNNPRKTNSWNLEPEGPPNGRGSFWEPKFLGSMLVFRMSKMHLLDLYFFFP